MDLSSEMIHALLPAFVTVTLALPAVALGAIDGVAESTASFAKLLSGRLSDRSRRRQPWILAGYGLAALSKPMFALASGWPMVMTARFADRVGKGLRGSARDALIADDTPAAVRGRAYGLRQSLDTIGALAAPVVAIVLMLALSNDIRSVFWIAVVPGFIAVLLIVVALREPERHRSGTPWKSVFHGFRELTGETRRLLAVAFFLTLARFSEGFLVLRGMKMGLSAALSPLALVVFNIGFLALAYPAGALSDSRSPRSILVAGIALLIVGNLALAADTGFAGLVVGVLLWGAHMALTQGILARMIADAAPEHLRATSFGAFHFTAGVATLASSVAAGIIWDQAGSSATFLAGASVAAAALVAIRFLKDRRPVVSG